MLKYIDINKFVALTLSIGLGFSLGTPNAQTVFPSTYDDSDTKTLAAPSTDDKDRSLTSARLAADQLQAEFWAALRQDDEWAFSNALHNGVPPNATTAKGNTALHEAVDAPAPRIAAMLMRQPGVDINARNKAGETPLMLALLRGQVAIAKALITAKAAINHPGWTPLHYAASATYEQAPEMLSLLLDNYAYIDTESPNGTTPLMMAARYGSSANVRALLVAGADAGLRNQQGLNALDFAKAGAKPDAVDMLSSGFADKDALPKGTW